MERKKQRMFFSPRLVTFRRDRVKTFLPPIVLPLTAHPFCLLYPPTSNLLSQRISRGRYEPWHSAIKDGCTSCLFGWRFCSQSNCLLALGGVGVGWASSSLSLNGPSSVGGQPE